MWCIIGIPVSFAAGYFLAAMMFTSKDNAEYEAEQGKMEYDWSRDEYRWKPYDKPTVIRLKQKENDDGNRN